MKHQKKNKVITYFLSFIPGAGFMYHNYMRRGISYLALFLGTISSISWLGIGLFSVIPIIIWFYSFFDQINMLGQPEESLSKQQDVSIFQSMMARVDVSVIEKEPRVLGTVCLILGISLLIQYIGEVMILFLPEGWQNILNKLLHTIPQMIVAGGIVYLGSYLSQKKEMALSFYHQLMRKRNDNVVYYMQQGQKEKPNPMDESVKGEGEVLKEVEREQILKKAKQLLDDEIYQSIHIDTASTLDSVQLELGKQLEQASQVEKVHIPEAPMVEKAPVIEKAADFERVEIDGPDNLF